MPVLDLDYVEDSGCDTDMNVVMTDAGHFIEVQGTAEGAAFDRAGMNRLLDLASAGIADLIAMQKQALGLALIDRAEPGTQNRGRTRRVRPRCTPPCAPVSALSKASGSKGLQCRTSNAARRQPPAALLDDIAP